MQKVLCKTQLVWLAAGLSLLANGRSAGAASVPGPIRDVFNPARGDSILIVYGTQGDSATTAYLKFLAARTFWIVANEKPELKMAVVPDTSITPPRGLEVSLVVLGTKRSNRILKEYERPLQVRVLPDQVFIGLNQFLGKDYTVAFVHPSPFNPFKYLLVLTGSSDSTLAMLPQIPDTFDFCLKQVHQYEKNRYYTAGFFAKGTLPWGLEEGAVKVTGKYRHYRVLLSPKLRLRYPRDWDTLLTPPQKLWLLRTAQKTHDVFAITYGFNLPRPFDLCLVDDLPGTTATDYARLYWKIDPLHLDTTVAPATGIALARFILSCPDAPSDWPTFVQSTGVAPATVFRRAKVIDSATVERPKPKEQVWFEEIVAPDTTYASILFAAANAYQPRALTSVINQVTHTLENPFVPMSTLLERLAARTGDRVIAQLARQAIPLPYDKPIRIRTGIPNLADHLQKDRVLTLASLPSSGAAAAAGMKKGDTLLSIDGISLDFQRALAYQRLAGKKKGDRILFGIQRGEKTLNIPITAR